MRSATTRLTSAALGAAILLAMAGASAAAATDDDIVVCCRAGDAAAGAVEDASGADCEDATLAACLAAGGTVVEEPSDDPDAGVVEVSASLAGSTITAARSGPCTVCPHGYQCKCDHATGTCACYIKPRHP